jgi:hypothetical protein
VFFCLLGIIEVEIDLLGWELPSTT